MLYVSPRLSPGAGGQASSEFASETTAFILVLFIGGGNHTSWLVGPFEANSVLYNVRPSN